MAELFSVAKAFIVPVGSIQPVELGVLKDISIDFTINEKELKGQNRFPLLIAQADGSVSGKAQFARFNAETLAILLGATKTVGAKLMATHPVTTLSATVTTVVVTNAATWTQDGGVILVGSDESKNIQMTAVAAAATPVTGQYKVVSGTYTFAAADAAAGIKVIADYVYTSVTGSTLTLPNPVMGSTAPFSLRAKSSYQGMDAIIEFPNVISGKFAMPLKLGEFSEFNFDFKVFADGSGNIGYLYTSF